MPTPPVPPAPRPPRAGPRPLALHMALLTATWLGSLAALPSLRKGSPFWRAELGDRARAIALEAASIAPEALARAVEAEARRRLEDFATGVAGYRRHAARRTLADPPVAWQAGTTRLLDYGATHAAGAGGAPLLVVPSLINRGYVLDLDERLSFLRWLAGRGFRPFLVDWGAPGAAETRFTLTDYVTVRLAGALAAVRRLDARPPVIVGYCMGGLLAVALAERHASGVAALALMATPWDFHASDGARVRVLKALAPHITALTEALGTLPVDVLQAMFMSLDPYLAGRKFRRFAATAPESEAARRFVLLEDWLNDGVPLAGAVARECLLGWYVDNAPARGTWEIAGRPVRPAEIALPALVLLPARDYIVPPASARALADALPAARSLAVKAGHIGMVAGSGAVEEVFTPLAAWLSGVPA